ncbi:MAG: tRNA-(ms[2]io[6]A)-hydroxylase [Myxococcota bacterium]
MKLRAQTPDQWLAAVNADVGAFLQDHASCEKKASGTALSIASHYPDRRELVKEMVALAREELLHFEQVFELLDARGLSLGRDEKDPYINAMLKNVRRDPDGFFLDRLILFGVVEARGCERFRILANGLDELVLRDYYAELARAEARHWAMFIRLAKRYFAPEVVDDRLQHMLEAEADVLQRMAIRSALH